MRAKRAENFGIWGGGTNILVGGTQDFHDGGGGVPPIFDNPELGNKGNCTVLNKMGPVPLKWERTC